MKFHFYPEIYQKITSSIYCLRVVEIQATLYFVWKKTWRNISPKMTGSAMKFIWNIIDLWLICLLQTKHLQSHYSVHLFLHLFLPFWTSCKTTEQRTTALINYWSIPQDRGHSIIMSRFWDIFNPPSPLSQTVTLTWPPPNNYGTHQQPPPPQK